MSVALFDGKGQISEMGSIITNRAGPDGVARQDVSRPFISGSYEVHPNGRGVIDFILDVDGRKAPNTMEFVVTQTFGGGCERIASFLQEVRVGSFKIIWLLHAGVRLRTFKHV